VNRLQIVGRSDGVGTSPAGKKTDPLLVIDLFEPARPEILGELKIPGLSTYIHRIDRSICSRSDSTRTTTATSPTSTA